MDRRHFLRTTAALPLAGSLPGGAFSLEAAAQPDTLRQVYPASIDGLGEIRLDYEPALLDEIIGSGMRCCVVTVGNPGLYGSDAFPDMAAEIAAPESGRQRSSVSGWPHCPRSSVPAASASSSIAGWRSPIPS